MIKTISKQDLTRLISNHKENPNLPVMTEAIFIGRDHFEDFLKSLPQDYDALKICFVRFPASVKDPKRISEAGNNLTQLSLIFVPVTGTDREKWSSSDVIDPAGNLIALCVCEPGVDDKNGTGVVPPKSGDDGGDG